MNKTTIQMHSKKILVVLLKMLVILIITLALSEIGLRSYNKLNPNFIFYDNSYNRFRGKPFSDNYGFKLNSKGFKDLEFSIDKGQKFRIVALGDSIAFGVVPYQYNYLTILEEQLNKNGHNVDVNNLGIPRIGPKEYLSILVNEGLELNPDMVLVSFFAGNDFINAGTIFGKRKSFEYLFTAQLVSYIYNRIAYVGGKYGKGQNYDDTAPTFTYSKFIDIVKKRVGIYHSEALFKKYFNAAVSYLRQINTICEENEIELVVVIMPGEVQVDKSLQSEIIRSFANISPEQWDFSMPNKELANYLREAKIDYIDLYDTFKSGSEDIRLYIPNDTHWNIPGNKLAADTIIEYLELTKFQSQ
jgi:lysophospholipase L1-like esterase